MNELRPWTRRLPRLALSSLYLATPLLFLLCMLYAFLAALEGFREGWGEMWPYTKNWLARGKCLLRKEIAGRKELSGTEAKN